MSETVGIPQQILCQLAALKKDINNINVPGSMIKTYTDPFDYQELFVGTTTPMQLTIPTGATICTIVIRGTGELRYMFNIAPTGDIHLKAYPDDQMTFNSLLEMQKIRFLATESLSLLVIYYRVISL